MIDRICTIGPSSNNRAVLEKLIEHGMTIARLNLSHGDHVDHKRVIENIRNINVEKKTNIKILGDLQGPKIRLGKIKTETKLRKNDFFKLTSKELEGDHTIASIDYKGLINDARIGSNLLINDGEVELLVKDITDDTIHTIIVKEGMISTRKGVNAPGTALNLPAITEKDKHDIHFLIENQIDFLACSFIRKPQHLHEVISFVSQLSTNRPIIMAKIETIEALQNFQEICSIADAIMIARGDLGVELPYQWIPYIQKALISECNRVGTYVVTATQMLQSMIENSIPTRAEATDVFQAVLDGTNAVMLSAESAAGMYPIESIQTLKILSEFSKSVKRDVPFDLTGVKLLLSKLTPTM